MSQQPATTRGIELIGGPHDGELVVLPIDNIAHIVAQHADARDARGAAHTIPDGAIHFQHGLYVMRDGAEAVLDRCPFDWQGWE